MCMSQESIGNTKCFHEVPVLESGLGEPFQVACELTRQISVSRFRRIFSSGVIAVLRRNRLYCNMTAIANSFTILIAEESLEVVCLPALGVVEGKT